MNAPRSANLKISTVVNYAHLQKADQYLTYQFPIPMEIDETEKWIEDNMPGWEIIFTSPDNPNK